MNMHSMPKETRGPKGQWPDAEVETLRRMWSEGAAVAVIAARVGHSKDSVYAKARAIGLPTLAKAKVHQAVEPFKPSKPINIIVDNDGPGVRLVDLDGSTCRWPLWADDTLPADKRFCGHEPVEGSPYCAKHKARGLNHA